MITTIIYYRINNNVLKIIKLNVRSVLRRVEYP